MQVGQSDSLEHVGDEKQTVQLRNGVKKNRTLTFHKEEFNLYSESPTVTSLQTSRFRDGLCDYSPTSAERDFASSSSSSTTLFPEAPDGGYGWVIVAASFLIHFICDGISFSFGILFPQIQEYFHTTTTMSGIVGSIFLSIPLLSGPIAAILTDIYDCRKMTIVGGIIAAAGAFTSYFAFGVWQFVFTFGFVIGIGLSFCYNTAIVAVTYYFQKRRALATGIAVCGSGAGTAVFAPFLEMLFTKFGWRVTLIFLGFLLLMLVGCGLLIKDLEWPQDTIEYKRRKFIEKSERAKLSNLIEAEQETVAATAEVVYGDVALRHAISLPMIPTFTELCLQKSNASASKHSVVLKEEAFSRCQSDGAFLRTKADNRNEPKSTENILVSLRAPISVETTNVPNDGLVTSQSAVTLGGLTAQPVIALESERMTRESCDDTTLEVRKQDPTLRTSVMETSQIVPMKEEREKLIVEKDLSTKKLENLKMPLLSSTEKNDKTKNVKIKTIHSADPTATVGKQYFLFPTSFGAAQSRVPASNVITFGWRYYGFNNLSRRAPSAPIIFFRRKRKSRVINVAKIMESCSEWFSVVASLLAVPSFVVFLISSFILYIFFDIPYVNFPEHATQHLNVTDTEASYLVAAVGIFNTISMLVCGFLADWSLMKKYLMQLYGTCIFLAGMCVLLAPFVTSYYVLMFLCAAFGFFISTNYVLTSVITVHLLCLYDFQTGYGLLSLVEGLGNLLGPGLIGYVRDHHTSYHYVFIYGGLGTALSGLMVVGIEVFLRCRRKRSNNASSRSLQGDPNVKGKVENAEKTGLCNGYAEEMK